MHGLIFETSIYNWQDQPGSYTLMPLCRVCSIYPTQELIGYIKGATLSIIYIYVRMIGKAGLTSVGPD